MIKTFLSLARFSFSRRHARAIAPLGSTIKLKFLIIICIAILTESSEADNPLKPFLTFIGKVISPGIGFSKASQIPCFLELIVNLSFNQKTFHGHSNHAVQQCTKNKQHYETLKQCHFLLLILRH